MTGVDASTARVQEAGRRIDALSASVGTSEIYQDAWDDNTQARAVNAELLNDLITTRNLFNELLQARMQMNLTKTSETVKTVKSDPAVNPYSCDPLILEETKVPRETWPHCAAIAATEADTSILSSETTDGAIGKNLLSIQNAATAAGDLP